jgi:Fe2+ or Zn2+ uptake regulation protein
MNTIAKIKQHGRLTKQKQQLLQALTPKPQTVAQIQTRLIKQKARLNLTTIYRTLEVFTILGIANKTQFQDQLARYELAGGGHHHHLVCEKCSAIANIALSQENFVKEAARQTDFKINSHLLEFFGLCRDCQRSK